MPGTKTNEKAGLHPRNRNRKPYDLKGMMRANAALAEFMKPNKYGEESIDFANPKAVKLLNQTLLKHYYGINYWDFSDENLCPPIPGRADYIHYIADLLSESNDGNIPTGKTVTCLDIGIGASCIYPIIGVVEYGWRFVGADVNSASIASSKRIVEQNSQLRDNITFRQQQNSKAIFEGIIKADDNIAATMCNPPFHSSEEEASKGTRRKIRNLTGKKPNETKLNFAGIADELIYEGGEYQFIKRMITESKNFAQNVNWFTTLVSKKENLNGIYSQLAFLEVKETKTIHMKTGNKASRIVAWRF